ncbi:hypothetical protein AVEN_92217-1 [Araneus ventricosus]|uniref:Uncharacterized protein n=1 Tax=Araneus ventricosus TaxID=182803 RepID=A0A4Y2AK76_ARAVE|nr:hypothetical protein AVEN_92217-1 [Araneus ventricosus]
MVSKFLQCWWRDCIHSLFDVTPPKKSPVGSGQMNVEAILRNAGMCPECTVGHLILCAEGRRRVGTIHSGGHSTANPLENRILRPSFSLFLGVANQTNMHLTPSIFNITIRKIVFSYEIDDAEQLCN